LDWFWSTSYAEFPLAVDENTTEVAEFRQVASLCIQD